MMLLPNDPAVPRTQRNWIAFKTSSFHAVIQSMAYEWVFLSLYLPVPGSSHKSVRGRYIYIKYYNAVPASKQSSQPRTECPTCQLRSQRFAADAWRTQKTRQTIPGMAQRHDLKPSPRHRLRMPRPLPPRIAFFPWLFFFCFLFSCLSAECWASENNKFRSGDSQMNLILFI